MNFENKKVTVMGLGLFGGGAGVAQFFSKHGARVTVTDLRSAGDLSPALKQLEGLPVSYKLGGHCEEDFSNADMVIVNPAVPGDSKYLQIAKNNQVLLDTEINLFFKLCPAPIIGITGSCGKSTTTTLLGNILQQTPYRTWVGGNIGKSLLVHLEEIKSQEIVILELSSFQLEGLHSIKKSPHISVVTNISPNHLDRYRNMEDYIEAKKGIVLYQKPGDFIILNYDDPELRTWVKECRSRIIWYSAQHTVNNGAFMKDGNIVISRNGEETTIPCISKIKVPGVHNLQNILAASCAAYLAGAKEHAIKKAVSSFTGLEHRLEFIGEVKGVSYYNDSKATTPESSLAAVTAFKSPIILIAGGYDKGSNFETFARISIKHTKAIILIGETALKIEQLIQRYKTTSEIPSVFTPKNLQEAFQQACTIGEKGDIVLLSPACASYDMFLNYEERGRQFKNMVYTLKRDIRYSGIQQV